MGTGRLNYLFPETEALPKGRMGSLPLNSGKTLEPIPKTEVKVKNAIATSPSADKEFFSFFKLSSHIHEGM